MNKKTYLVPDISSGHCRAAITAEVGAIPGVASVDVDLDAQRVTVTGQALDGGAIRDAIYDAGYEVLEDADVPERIYRYRPGGERE
jgi:copper chaperone